MHDRLVSRRIDALHQCFLVVFCDTPQASFWINEIIRGLGRAVKLPITKLVYSVLELPLGHALGSG